jgi:hypothetical protein
VTVQYVVVGLLVAAAVAFLVWKIGISGASRPRKPGGPDVPADRLLKKRNPPP